MCHRLTELLCACLQFLIDVAVCAVHGAETKYPRTMRPQMLHGKKKKNIYGHVFIFVLMQIDPMRGCVISCTSHRLLTLRGKQPERIWPLSDFLGVLPDYVVLAENEEGPVDGEAVLPDRYGVVQGHGASTLRFGLLEGWGDATCGHGSPVAVPVALGPSVPRTQQARHVVPEAGHPVGKAKPKEGKKRGENPGEGVHCESGDGEAGL